MSNPFVARLTRRRRSHRRHHRRGGRRRRSNPSLSSFTKGNMLETIGGGAIGFFAARMLPANVPMLSQYNNGIIGYGLNLASGMLAAWGLKKVWSPSAAKGALIGAGVAVAARIYEEKVSPAGGGTAGLGDLGYYIADGFPARWGNPSAGPFAQFPGVPYGSAPMLPTAASAVKAGQAAAAMAAGPAASGSGNWGGNF